MTLMTSNTFLNKQRLSITYSAIVMLYVYDNILNE